ncbi:MAG: hypothetical protein ACYSW8_26040 [Planctomycetota bacterium]|jgi:hypothetical protein
MSEEDGAVVVADPPVVDPPETPEYLNDPAYEELMGDESNKNILSRYKEPHELAKALVEKEKTIRSGFKMPKKLNDEQLAEVRGYMNTVNGVPEKPEGYDMVRPEEVPEDMDFSEQTKMELRAYAKEKDIGKDVFQGMYELAMQAMKRAGDTQTRDFEESQKTARTTMRTAMNGLWGTLKMNKILGEGDTVGILDSNVKSFAIDEGEYEALSNALNSSGLRNNRLLVAVLGQAALDAQILRASASPNPTEFQQSEGTKTLSKEAERARRNPNTPVSLGGGKPD